MDQLRAAVCITGAGFAGLAAAYNLKQAGKTAAVLEARERIGGRVYSYSDLQLHIRQTGAKSIHTTLVHCGCRRSKSGRHFSEPHCANLVWTDLDYAA
jgi:monoamine oxidase